ncbi:MAG: formylglycine-generating enzyme family protein [Deltaproteobacteria bacterium]|nr:formylglycine-generating enzyme family protein [Deltaproteobacteria bacterium]
MCEGGCGSPGCFPCPDSPKVNIPGNYTISATEVSNADYELFLNEDFAPGFLDSWLPPECAWKTDFTPDEWPSSDNLPVAGVDWCDAWAYCEWSGQHMCGKVGGGPSPMNDVQNPNTNEWFKACSQGGIKNYPYGLVYNGALCNGVDAGFEELTEVGSIATCQGGYNGIYDMSGNVWEWTNECVVDGQIPAQDQQCRQRGGSFYSNGPTLRCGVDSTRARNFRNDNLGIRCCDSL